MENPYIKIDTVAAEHLSRPSLNPGGEPPRRKINRKTLRLGPLSRRGVYLAFQDLGACMALVSVRVFYHRCPPVTSQLAAFPGTLPRELVTPVAGKCLGGAVPAGTSSGVSPHPEKNPPEEEEPQNNPQTPPQHPPLMYCGEDGRWVQPPARGCLCRAGWEREGEGCRACPPQTFKAGVGEGRCLPCPPRSSSPAPGSASCVCRGGTYRAEGEGPEGGCWAPPSAPRSLVAHQNGSGVRLQWGPPAQGGGRPDLTYSVGCRVCGQGGAGTPPEEEEEEEEGGEGACGPCTRLTFDPGRGGLRGLGVWVWGLRPHLTYGFSVTARSGVTPKSPLPPPAAHINVTLSAQVPLPVVDVVRVGGSPTGVTLSWPPPPPDPPGGPVLDYEVKYYEKLGGGEGPPMFLKVPSARAELWGLRRGGVYGVRVRARSEGGYGDFGPETAVSPQAAEGSRGEPGGLVLGAAALGGLLVLALLGGALSCYRRHQRRKRPQNPPGSGRKFYIDPLTYEDPGVALRELAQEIDVTCVRIEEVIGAGEFGEVCRGRLCLPGVPEVAVAVKMLKGGAGEGQRRDFLGEAARMGQFCHPNVVRLRGVVTATNPTMILTEFMENGALDAFLRAHAGSLSPLQLLGMLRGVGAAMFYLSSLGFVHRDLAARNVLLDAHLVCKLCDFGLSRALPRDPHPDPTYTSTLGGKIPIRWTAPEAIALRTFSSASDVWSFGILMWEVMAFGERPYWDMANQEVIDAIEQGYRLPPPPRCPPALHRLMLECWRGERGERPQFPDIIRALDRLIRHPQSLRTPPDPTTPPQRASSPPQLSPPGAPNPPGCPPPGGTNVELLPPLHSGDLLRLGVTLPGPQRRLLESTQSPPDPPKGEAPS